MAIPAVAPVLRPWAPPDEEDPVCVDSEVVEVRVPPEVVVAETEAGPLVVVSTVVDEIATESSMISQPEIAIAPTWELLCMVVVRVVYVPDCLDA